MPELASLHAAILAENHAVHPHPGPPTGDTPCQAFDCPRTDAQPHGPDLLCAFHRNEQTPRASLRRPRHKGHQT